MLVLAFAALLATPPATPTPKFVQPVRVSGESPDPKRLRGDRRKFRRINNPVAEAKIRTDGTVSDVRVKRSCGCPAGDRLLVETLKTWKYKPALSDGKPVESQVTVSVSDYWELLLRAASSAPEQ